MLGRPRGSQVPHETEVGQRSFEVGGGEEGPASAPVPGLLSWVWENPDPASSGVPNGDGPYPQGSSKGGSFSISDKNQGLVSSPGTF